MNDPCSSVSQLLERYFDRESTDQEKTRVETHLLDCPSCRQALKSMEELSHLMKVPVEEYAGKKDLERVWLRVKRETQFEVKPSWGQVFRSWFGLPALLRKRVLIPAVAAIMLLVFITAYPLFEKSPSLPGQFGVEYVDSETNNVMVYEIEKANMTVIWLFEGPDEEPAPS
jgi:anti-sigma factor RsiW